MKKLNTYRLSIKSTGRLLMSRSQARRIMEALPETGEITLDFDGVDTIAQGFADELFRVWLLKHVDIKLNVIYANSAVSNMISHVKSRQDLPQPRKGQVTVTGQHDETTPVQAPSNH